MNQTYDAEFGDYSYSLQSLFNFDKKLLWHIILCTKNCSQFKDALLSLDSQKLRYTRCR